MEQGRNYFAWCLWHGKAADCLMMGMGGARGSTYLGEVDENSGCIRFAAFELTKQFFSIRKSQHFSSRLSQMADER